jgi:hypothetical protein
MNVILGIDGLEYDYVEKFGLKNLIQKSHGKTDISDYEEPRTIVIWSSFLSGENREKEILALGKKKMWDFKLKPEDTFFNPYASWKAIDVPGFTFIRENHSRERELLKGYFNKKNTIEDYDNHVFKTHRKIKEEFLADLDSDHDILMGYFNLADVVGHLSFGVEPKMKAIYMEFDDLAKTVAAKADKLLVISDHGMQAVGRYGDHSRHGFWSLNYIADLEEPKITDFHDIITGWRKDKGE